MTIHVHQALPSALRHQDIERVGDALARTLRLRKHHCVSVSFVGEVGMRDLNRRFRNKDRATDVLSFQPLVVPGVDQDDDLGDVVLCPVYAKREARRRGISAREEFIRLIIHGVLHLRGYDHLTEDEEMRMFALQERILEGVFSI